jgi:RimJ/RimL family protein N-acetyltransferase
MEDLASWVPRPAPSATVLDGKFARLEKLSAAKHIAAGLRDAVLCKDAYTRFLYLLQYPPKNEEELLVDMTKKEASPDPYFFATIIKETGKAGGYISIMRIAPEHGVYEIGNVYMGPDVARSRVSTEAVYLLLQYAFDELGYRRVEWKCNSLNEKSKSAALRFGFQYEGLFRKHLMIKGQNRDTAWFAMTDDDWTSGVRDSFIKWLNDANFTADGVQIGTLASFRPVNAGSV